MARFLKIVCNTLIVLAVAIAVALLLPPIMGVTTTIIDNQGIRSNLPVGSVTYSRKVNSDNLQKGDLVLVESKNEAYEYTVVSVDVVAKKMIVKNAFDKSAEEKELKVTSGVSRVSFTIPFIGFAVVAMQTVEGMIVIGLIVLFIIILYILSEVWKKKPEEEEAVKADREKSGKERKTPSAPSGVSSVVSARSSGKTQNAGLAAGAAAAAAGGAVAAGAAVVAGAAAAVAAGNLKKQEEASETSKDAEADAKKDALNAETELSEEEFKRIVAQAEAKHGAEVAMEIGLDGWRPSETPDVDVSWTAAGALTAAAATAEPAAEEAKMEKTAAAGEETKAEKTAVAEEGTKTEKSADAAEEEKKAEETPAKNQEEGDFVEEKGKKAKKKKTPPRRKSLDEMLEYAKKSGGDPEFRKDDVSGLDVVDYSSFL